MEWIIFGAKGRGETNQRCKVPGSSHLAKQMLCVCACTRARVCSVMSSSMQSLGLAHGALLPMEFSRQEYWCGLLFPSPGDLPNPEIEPKFPVSPALAGRFFTTSTTWEAKQMRPQFLRCLHNQPQNQ